MAFFIKQGFLNFDRLFSEPPGRGYSLPRSESQAQSRQRLAMISCLAHRPMAEILRLLPDAVFKPAVEFPGFLALLERTGAPNDRPIAVS